MRKKVLITGIGGQDGAYLAKIMLDSGHAVFAGIRRNSAGVFHRLNELGIADQINFLELDLIDQESIVRAIRDTRPDELYNLAASSFVGTSWQQPAYKSQVNGFGVLHLLEAIRMHSGDTRFYQASTSELFGNSQVSPQSEMTPFSPRSPYGVAKSYAHWMTRNYRDSFGLFAASGILFNHESPLRGSQYVTRKITLAFARIAQGLQDTLELGNLDAQRDWGYAREYVEGMVSMLSAQKGEDFVLATGKTNTIRAFVEVVAKLSGFELEWFGEGINETGRDRKSGALLVKINAKFYRPAENTLLVGNPAKARRDLGWEAKTTFPDLVELMYRADFDRVAANSVHY